jgi:hypothetical protein
MQTSQTNARFQTSQTNTRSMTGLYDDDSYISVKEHSITYSAYMKKKLSKTFPQYKNGFEPVEESVDDYYHRHDPLLVEQGIQDLFCGYCQECE